MYKPDLNSSFMSENDVPVGFRSFSQDAFAQNNEQNYQMNPQEISFAKEIEKLDPVSPAQEMVLGEIQNRGSFGIDDF